MKKGFTLVELLAVIILLGLLGLIIYPTVTGVINSNKQKLHDKQIEELKRHAFTYSSMNMSKMRTYNNARNVVTFKDLYDAGIIQNEVVIDPLNDQEMTGCIALIWKTDINNFEVEFSDDCEKYEFTDASCFSYEENDTGLTITKYNRTCPMDVVIPEFIDGKYVTYIGYAAFAGYDEIYEQYPDEMLLTSVVIPDTVTRIGAYAFEANKITTLKLGNRVERIGQDSFSSNLLSEVVIPDSVTVLGSSFAENRLEKVTLSKNITSIPSFSFNDNQLKEIVIPNSVTIIGNSAFRNNQLEKVDLGTGVREIDNNAFDNNNISSITFPDSLIAIGLQTFMSNKLTTVVIPDKVTNIGYSAFEGNQLTTVTIGTNVNHITGDAFYKNSTSNPNLSKIINKSGRAFVWYQITGCSSDSTSFETGTVTCSPSNIEITSN